MMLEAFGKSEISGYIATGITGGLGAAILLRFDWTRKPDGKLRFWPVFFGLFFIFSIARPLIFSVTHAAVSECARHFHF
jgi:hypothetical protein